MDISTLSQLRGIYQSLTMAQRAQLLAIVQGDQQPVTTPICERLVSLGLIHLKKDEYWTKYIATKDGRYVANLS